MMQTVHFAISKECTKLVYCSHIGKSYYIELIKNHGFQERMNKL